MRSYITSYNALFTRRHPDSPDVERIEIPIIQRDYAQGREGSTVERIRTDFLNVLHRAVTGGERASLDFVYGDVKNGTLHPLDGQQRLTTLFLLHWYLAFRSERIDQENGWKRFSYATRPSSRLFCERLTECQPPTTINSVSEWIQDQSWYLHTWNHDPTIQSMLVMIDAMHKRFCDDDCLTAWNRLVDAEIPAISFHLLPIEKMGLSEDLYIKMNSRGKPLTRFENFKARFEQMLESSCPERAKEFSIKVDGAWSDLLWPYRGNDSIVDDEFLRYFNFITEVCEWKEDRFAVEDITLLSQNVYGQEKPNVAAHLEFLFQALDAWVNVDIKEVFSSIFTMPSVSSESKDMNKVVLFGPRGGMDIDLFSACCRAYGQIRGKNRVFSWSNTLYLFAVLIQRLYQTEDFLRRLRVLRNLVEASDNELRLEKMPALIADVHRVVIDGNIEDVSAFNQSQVTDERLKSDFLAKCPRLERTLVDLENHPLLRGCLASFELDDLVFERRAVAFHQLFSDRSCLPALTGALIALGDYSRQLNPRQLQFGSGVNLDPWREVLTGAGRSSIVAVRKVFGMLLDVVSQATGNLEKALEAIQREWLDATVEGDGLGWRWYFVKYPVMRSGKSGIYAGSGGLLAYSVCMLDKTQMNSRYRDPYLSAIHQESGVEDAVEDLLFTGYETEPRWMRLKKSGTELQCVDEGLIFRPPLVPEQAEVFSRISAQYGLDADHMLRVPQIECNGRKLDTCDRVQLGASLVRDLVAAGL